MGRSPYTRLVSTVLFPVHEWAKGHGTRRVHRFLEQSQWWSREKIEAYQLERLRNFLLGIGRDVPFYAKRFSDSGFDPRALATLDDLARLPLLDKETIRRNADSMRAPAATHLSRFNTGGSSGEPLIFYLGRERVSHDVAAKWRATRWWGVDIGDPEVVVWGSPIELGAQDRLRALRDRMFRTRLLSAFEMSEQQLGRFVTEIRKHRPKMLFGYPSAIAHIAKYAEAQGTAMDDLGIEVAFVTAEKLYDDQRERIAKVFGCRVANGYGARDAGFVAHECPQGQLHITAEDIVVEIADEHGGRLPAGVAGEIVVTHMATKDFPFVRYRTGDVGVLSPDSCPCGRGLPVLAEVQGRTTEFVVAEDGPVLHGLALIYVLRDLPGVAKFKIVQDTQRLVRVLLVPEGDLSQATATAIRNGLQARLGQGVEVRIERVSDIPAEASGKFRYVTSHVASGQFGRTSAGRESAVNS
ncbi:MAG: AMP-binding protein [Gammaproteobacteria bacterium]